MHGRTKTYALVKLFAYGTLNL